MIEAAEHEVRAGRDLEGAQIVVLALEGRRHAALPLHALLEGDPEQLATLVIGPGVVDAGEAASVTEPFQTQKRAAVGAAILEGVDGPVLRPHHDHRHVAHGGRLVVARIRDLAFQRQIVPGRPHEDPLALPRVNVGVAIQLVGNMGVARLRPQVARGVRRRAGRARFRIRTCLHHLALPNFLVCDNIPD